MKKLLLNLALLAIAGFAVPALAADAPKLDSGDTAWMLTSTVLVIVMIIPGLALFYGGMVRPKNVLSILMQVFVGFSLISVRWACISAWKSATGRRTISKTLPAGSKSLSEAATV